MTQRSETGAGENPAKRSMRLTCLVHRLFKHELSDDSLISGLDTLL